MYERSSLETVVWNTLVRVSLPKVQTSLHAQANRYIIKQQCLTWQVFPGLIPKLQTQDAYLFVKYYLFKM